MLCCTHKAFSDTTPRRANRPALGRGMTQFGLGSACVSALQAMGCCAPAAGPLLAGLSTLGLGFLVNLSLQMPILYGALALTLGGLGLAGWRQRQRLPLPRTQ